MTNYTTPAHATAGTPATASDFNTHETDILYLYERGLIGRAAFAYADGMSITDTPTSARTLAASGGATLLPILVPAQMYVQSLSIYNTDTATARSWEWRLFREPDAGSATLVEVSGINGSESFTPGGAASVRTVNATTPGLIQPGLYWLAVRCSHATNSFGIGTVATGTLAGNASRTKSGVAALTTTLDASTGWTGTTPLVGARLNGRVAGEGSAF
jgi:hypothetical protein